MPINDQEERAGKSCERYRGVDAENTYIRTDGICDLCFARGVSRHGRVIAFPDGRP
jgi:hypothetical protein